MSAEFLLKIGNLNPKYSYKCISVADIFINIGENIEAVIKEEDILNHFLREQRDFQNRNALEIIAENRFYKLLNNGNVCSIINKLWFGSGKHIDIFQFSKIPRIIFHNSILHEKYDDIVKSYDDNEIQTKSFSFQYCEYINNCSVRYLIDSLSNIMSSILFQYVIYLFVELKKGDENTEPQDPFTNKNFNFINTISSIVVYSNIIQAIMFFIYYIKTGRKNSFNLANVVDLLTIVAVTLNLINFKKILNIKLVDSSLEKKSLLNLLEIYDDYKGDNDNIVFNTDFINGIGHIIDSIIFSIIIICAWARVIMILVTTRIFGPFIRILYLILKTMINFFIIYCCYNTMMAQIFTMFFIRANDDFNEFYKSWVYLYVYSFGNNNLNFYAINNIGIYFLMIHTIISNVILLNFAVSIADIMYNENEALADSENRSVLIINYERIKWDQNYGLLILLPAPLNLISLPFSLILLLIDAKNKPYFNDLFSKICFFPLALIMNLVMVVLSVLLYPFSLLVSIVHSCYQNRKKISVIGISKGILHLIMRPFELIFFLFYDIIIYWKICYVSREVVVSKEEERTSILNKPIIDILRKTIIEYMLKTKKKFISIDEIYKILRCTSDDLIKESKKFQSLQIIDDQNSSENNKKSKIEVLLGIIINFKSNQNQKSKMAKEAKEVKEKDNFEKMSNDNKLSENDKSKSDKDSNKDEAIKEQKEREREETFNLKKKHFSKKSNNVYSKGKNRFPSMFLTSNPSGKLNLSNKTELPSLTNNALSLHVHPKKNFKEDDFPIKKESSNIELGIINENLSDSFSIDKEYEEKIKNQLSKFETKLALRYLCNKLADKDGIINIERTLVLLPYRVKISKNYYETMDNLDIKYILKGLKNHFYDNSLNNSIYSYKKLQQMLIKITIKTKILQNFIPESIFKSMLISNKEINNNQENQKNANNIKKLEEKDEFSDLDIDGDIFNAYLSKNNNETKKQVSDLSSFNNQGSTDLNQISNSNIPSVN